MPYSLKKIGKRYCVINKQTGRQMGCSPTKEKAKSHMRALYHAESGKKFTRSKK